MNRIEEFTAKHERLRALLDAEGAEAVLLRSRANIAWLGSGPADGVPFDRVQGSRSEVWAPSDTGVMSFIVTRDEVTLLTENIELPRLRRDEFADLPLNIIGQPWHESDLARGLADVVRRRDATIVTDLAEAPLLDGFAAHGRTLADRRAAIAACRASLLPRELDRYRWLGRTAATVMTAICHGIETGMLEVAVVAEAAGRLKRVGITQQVEIVCSDGRLWEDRHALYSDRSIDRLAMVVFCAQKWSLVANLTRMVHLGPLPDDLAERHAALAALDADLMAATRPGVPLADLFIGTIQPGYAALGEAEAWRDHHQGGSTGYTGRDQRVTPTTPGIVQPNQAFAWNPSLPGIKSEDTFVAADRGPEVLTGDPDWPVYPDNGRPRIVELTRR